MLAGVPDQSSTLNQAKLFSPIVLAHELPFRVGDAEFHPATREILFGGETAIIEPRVMQLLVALHRADGGVVSKDDLAALCWEGRIVGEDAINRVVSRARSVGEKRAGGQFRIETITKVGYRLVTANGQALDALHPATPEPTERTIGRRDLVIAGTAVTALAAAGIGWTWFEPNRIPHDARLLMDDARNSLYQATVEQTTNAVGKLRQATQLAPENAEAWGLLSLAYANSAASAPMDRRSNLIARAEEAKRRAFAVETDQPDAVAAGLFMLPLFRNWYNFEQACRTALSRHPDHPVIQTLLGYLLIQVGRDREALSLYESALRRAPLSAPSLLSQAIILWDLGRFDEADTVVDHAIGLLPGQYGFWFTKLYYLMFNGRAKEAVAMVDDTANRPMGIPDWNFELVGMGARAIASGDHAAIRIAVSAWSAAAEKGTGFTENAAILAAFAGDVDESFRLLNALYFNRGFAMPDAYFSKDQRMYSGVERHTYTLFRRPIAAIRRDPRFAALTSELGLDDYWARTNSRPLVVP